jgi:hypothetical protein
LVGDSCTLIRERASGMPTEDIKIPTKDGKGLVGKCPPGSAFQVSGLTRKKARLEGQACGAHILLK